MVHRALGNKDFGIQSSLSNGSYLNVGVRFIIPNKQLSPMEIKLQPGAAIFLYPTA
jgi:hypothetical protein